MARAHSVVLGLALSGLGLLVGACGEDPAAMGNAPRAGEGETAPAENIEIEARIPIIPSYPCSSCHKDRTPNPTQRKLVLFHTVRNNEFHHGDAKAWCYNCHSVENPDRLIIPNGSLVTFNEAYKLCGGCHGDKLRDWNQDVHGKTRGYWTGPKRRLSCPSCHNPHRPKFGQIAPEPPPMRPQEIVE